jgi:hypothetical protein
LPYDLSRVKPKLKRQRCDDCGQVRPWLFPFAYDRLKGWFQLVCSGCRKHYEYDKYIKHWPGPKKEVA